MVSTETEITTNRSTALTFRVVASNKKTWVSYTINIEEDRRKAKTRLYNQMARGEVPPGPRSDSWDETTGPMY